MTQKDRIDFTATAILVVICASWGLQQVTIKIANQGVSPILQAGIRSVGASILLWIWMAAHRQPIFAKDGTLWWGIAAGLLFTAEFILVYWGLEFTNASRLVSFNFLTPIFGVIAGAVFLNEQITNRLLLTLFLVGTGIYLVNRPVPDREDDV